jgi:hypothetical protein
MSEKNKPVCQWTTCPRSKEIGSDGWISFQYNCVDRIYDQHRGTYVCDPENEFGTKGNA